MPLIVLLVYLAVIGLLVWGGFWLWRRRPSADRAEPLDAPADVTRLALASLWLRGPAFRGTILRRAGNPFRALPPEPGMDFPLVLAAARRFDRDEQGYWWVLAALLLGLILFREPGWLILLWLLAMAVVAVRRRWRIRFQLAPWFTRGRFDAARLRRELGLVEAPAQGGVPVAVHGTADPFVGLGANLGGWNLAFDVRRPAAGQGEVNGDLTAAAIEEAICASIRRLGLANLALDEVLFVNGSLTRASGIQPEPFGRPPARVGDEVAQAFRGGADPAARTYRHAAISEWSGEMVLSFLFRCLRRGDVLAVEAVQLALTPVDRPYRAVDRLRTLGLLGTLNWWLESIVATPFDVVTSVGVVVRRTFEVIDEAVTGGAEAREKREIAADPTYNYGALWSLRSHISARDYASYFQKADAVQYFRGLIEQVLNAVRDCLSAHGIDASAMDAQATVIHNNTVQITGARDVALSGVAVGAGAGAQAGALGRARRAISGGKR